MTIAFWCVLAAAVLPYIFTGVAKAGGGKYNNKSPREFLDKQEGYRKRANFAQLNSFEAFPAFAAAVVIAHIAGNASQGMMDGLAMGFIAARVAYGLCYIFDLATLRSLVWTAGFGCIVALFVVSA
jgi:uncharacterized MAPEG superfamily protein